jgi:hypothetical protein
MEENGRLSEPARRVQDRAGKKGPSPSFFVHEEMTTD